MKERFVREKKAQFYLIAALIIVALVIGFASLRNYSIKGDEKSAVYDLGKELGIESGEIIDYGTFAEQDVNVLVDKFADDYVKYSQGKIEKERWYFVYSEGKQGTKPSIIVFDEELLGQVNTNVGGIVLQDLQNTIIKKAKIELNDPRQEGDDNVYEFKIRNEETTKIKLKQGQSFYFLIREKRGDEQHVVEGKN